MTRFISAFLLLLVLLVGYLVWPFFGLQALGAELLRGGTIQSELGAVSFKTKELPNFTLNAAWNGWLSSEYRLDHFSIGWPIDATATEQFRLRMQLIAWRWKLTGIDLPDKLRDQFARELAKKYP